MLKMLETKIEMCLLVLEFTNLNRFNVLSCVLVKEKGRLMQ